MPHLTMRESLIAQQLQTVTVMKKNNTSTQQSGMKKNSKSSLPKLQSNDIASDDEGFEYPLDLWYLISEYIQPEAVGKFASICKGSYQVVKTGKFWFHLYKRFYKPISNLPERLKPECMVRRCGLRACVIRTLHFTHFSAFDKVKSNEYFVQSEPHSLVNRQCILMWHKKGTTRWYFFFKLKKTAKCRAVHKQINYKRNREIDLLDVQEDIFENPEEDCRILRVACLNYQMVPLATGLILQFVKLDLSPGFGHYRLQLNFGNTYIPKTPTQVLVLGGVIDCKALDWWHPYYPHQDGLPNPLPVMDSWESQLSFDSMPCLAKSTTF